MVWEVFGEAGREATVKNRRFIFILVITLIFLLGIWFYFDQVNLPVYRMGNDLLVMNNIVYVPDDSGVVATGWGKSEEQAMAALYMP